MNTASPPPPIKALEIKNTIVGQHWNQHLLLELVEGT